MLFLTHGSRHYSHTERKYHRALIGVKIFDNPHQTFNRGAKVASYIYDSFVVFVLRILWLSLVLENHCLVVGNRYLCSATHVILMPATFTLPYAESIVNTAMMGSLLTNNTYR